jgi:hypothetical protein
VTRTPGRFLAGLPRSPDTAAPPECQDYTPRDAAERAETYRQWAGTAQKWPVPLTPCRPGLS